MKSDFKLRIDRIAMNNLWDYRKKSHFENIIKKVDEPTGDLILLAFEV